MPGASVARSLASVCASPFTSIRACSSARNFQLAAAAGDAGSAAQTRITRTGQGWRRRRTATMEFPHTNVGIMIAGAAAPGIYRAAESAAEKPAHRRFKLRSRASPLRRVVERGGGPGWRAGGARSGARRRGLQAAPEEVREPPEHAGGRRPAPRLRAIAHREVGDERRAEVDGEAGIGPLLEPRRHWRKQQHHAEELGPRELHPEVG